MRARSTRRAFAVLGAAGILLVAAGCGSDDDNSSSSAGDTSTAAAPAKKAIKVGLVTDIGGLNDRSFNSLANKGLQDAKASSASHGRVLTSKSNADYVPNLSTLAQQKYDLVVGVGFLMADAVGTVAKKFPDTKFAIIDVDATAPEGQARQRPGPAVQGAGVRLPGGLPRRALRQGQQHQDDLERRRPEDPAGRPLHRRLPGRRQGGQPGDQDAQRLLPGLRRPGEVQGDRAQPDRPGLRGRLPGRRPVRPRRAGRGQGEGHAGHRRRRRPGLPRRRTS